MAKVREATIQKDVKFQLPNERVLIKPIVRSGGWLKEGHSGSYMYDNAKLVITPAIDRNTGYLKQVLTEEEREFFENSDEFDYRPGQLTTSKSIKGSFWENYEVRIMKSDTIVNDDTVLMVLDLSNPKHYLDYCVLRTNTSPVGGKVAPDWDRRLDSGEYKIALVREKDKNKEKIQRSELRRKAYNYLSTIEGDEEKLHDVLAIWFLTNKSAKEPPANATKDFYIGEIENIIDNNLAEFVDKVVEDKDNYEYKVLIHAAVKATVLKYGRNTGFETLDGIFIGGDLNSAVKYLKDERNQDVYLKIRTQVDLQK